MPALPRHLGAQDDTSSWLQWMSIRIYSAIFRIKLSEQEITAFLSQQRRQDVSATDIHQKTDESPCPSVISCSLFDNPQTCKGNKLFFNILLTVFLLYHEDIGQNITSLLSPSPTQSYDAGFLLHFYCSISISMDYPRTIKKESKFSITQLEGKNGKELLKVLDSLQQVTKNKLFTLSSCKLRTEWATASWVQWSRAQCYPVHEMPCWKNNHPERQPQQGLQRGWVRKRSACQWHLSTKSATWQLYPTV